MAWWACNPQKSWHLISSDSSNILGSFLAGKVLWFSCRQLAVRSWVSEDKWVGDISSISWGLFMIGFTTSIRKPSRYDFQPHWSHPSFCPEWQGPILGRRGARWISVAGDAAAHQMDGIRSIRDVLSWENDWSRLRWGSKIALLIFLMLKSSATWPYCWFLQFEF